MRLDDETLYEIATVGRFSTSQGLFIEVIVHERDEGRIPHVHLFRENGDDFRCCVRLDIPEYFNHGECQNRLNSHQRKDFIRFMERPPRSSSVRKLFSTNWELACLLWNNAFPQNEIDCDMPDYRKLPDKE